MHRQFIKYLFLGFVLLKVNLPSTAQTISFSNLFSIDAYNTSFSVLGKADEKIFVLSKTIGKPPLLLVLNNQLEILNSSEQPAFRNSIVQTFIPTKEGADILIEKFERGYRSYQLFRTYLKTENTKEIIRLPYEMGNNWEFISSPENKYFLIYNLAEVKKDSVKINMLLIGSDYEAIDGKMFSFYVEEGFERLGKVFIDESGNIYTMVYDQPQSYKLGSRLKLYKYILQTRKLLKKEYYLKEKKPAEVHLSFLPSKNQIHLHSLYYDFYKKDVNGIFSAVLDEKLELVKPFNYFEFEKQFKKDLNTVTSGVSSNDLMNYLRINNISFNEDGSSFASLVLESEYIRESNLDFLPVPAKINTSPVMDDDPFFGLMQREQLIRREMGIGGRGQRSQSSSSNVSPAVGYSEAYFTVMNQRPDLFFTNPDTTGMNKKIETPFLKMKIYDRQVVFAFDPDAGMVWKKWFETEDQSIINKTPLVPAETDNSIVSVYYRHNVKDKSELAFTRIAKPDGTYFDKTLVIPPNISLLTSTTLLNLNNNQAVILYMDNISNKVGLAKVEW